MTNLDVWQLVGLIDNVLSPKVSKSSHSVRPPRVTKVVTLLPLMVTLIL